jgi:hypothetical protein
MAGAKNRKKMNPEMTEYLTSLLFLKNEHAICCNWWNASHMSAGHCSAEFVIARKTCLTYPCNKTYIEQGSSNFVVTCQNYKKLHLQLDFLGWKLLLLVFQA